MYNEKAIENIYLSAFETFRMCGIRWSEIQQNFISWCEIISTKFDFQRRICNKVTLFSLKSFYSSLTKSTLQATAVRFFTSTFNLHKVTSFYDVTAVKNQRHLTT